MGLSYHIHACMQLSLTSIPWKYDTFEYSLTMNHWFTKYLKESYELGSDQYISFKYFQ